MAFKMTPGIKGNPAQSRIAGLGACGGPGQPPCEPRFEKEVKEERRMRKSLRSKVKVKAGIPVEAPIKNPPKDQPEPPVQAPPKNPPVKFTINLPKEYRFKSKLKKAQFYEAVNEAISQGEFENQEQLDKYVMKQLVNAPKPPIDVIDLDKPIFNPDKPILNPGTIKEGQKYESELNDKMKAASIEQAKARFIPIESSAVSKIKPKG